MKIQVKGGIGTHRVTIPLSIARAMNITKKSEFELELNNNTLILKYTKPSGETN